MNNNLRYEHKTIDIGCDMEPCIIVTENAR